MKMDAAVIEPLNDTNGVSETFPPANVIESEFERHESKPSKLSLWRTLQNIKIEEEFKALIPPISPEEKNQLAKSIFRYGVRDPISVWETADGMFLLDGHNRFEICLAAHQPVQVKRIFLHSREHALLWIQENQVSRRNLTDDQRAMIWNDIRERRSEIERKARAAAANQIKATPTLSVKTSDKEKPKKDTRAAVAKEAKLPERKIRAAQEIKAADPNLATQVKEGKMTMKQAMRRVKPPTPEEKQEALAFSLFTIANDEFCVGKWSDKHGYFLMHREDSSANDSIRFYMRKWDNAALYWTATLQISASLAVSKITRAQVVKFFPKALESLSNLKKELLMEIK